MSRKKNKGREEPQVLVVQQPADGTVLWEEKLPAIQRVVAAIATCYQPQAMARPRIDEDFQRMTCVVRVAEACRYQVARLLYQASPGGWVQAWWRLCVAGFLTILPVLGVLYLTMLGLTLILGSMEAATLALQQIALHLARFAALGVVILLTISFAAMVVKGTGLAIKNTLLTTLLAIVSILILGVAGIAWLASQFPALERLLNYVFQAR